MTYSTILLIKMIWIASGVGVTDKIIFIPISSAYRFQGHGFRPKPFQLNQTLQWFSNLNFSFNPSLSTAGKNFPAATSAPQLYFTHSLLHSHIPLLHGSLGNFMLCPEEIGRSTQISFNNEFPKLN